MIAIATSSALPHTDEDQPLLDAALRARGVKAELAAWDDPAVQWDRYAAVVIRSTWNYFHQVDAFVAWSRSMKSLHNSAATIAWNSDKTYLSRFPNAVPTELVARGSNEDLATLARDRGWSRVVVKPRYSAGSFETHRFDVASLQGGELARCSADRDVLVQPYVRSVEDYGERSLVWIDGALTHAIRKSPRFSSDEESVAPMALSDDERAAAQEILARVAEPLLYARIDLARDEHDHPMLMELELIEPSLFLRHSAYAVDRLADAIARL